MHRLLHDLVKSTLTIIKHQEKTMADLAKLNEAIAVLSAKVDALNAKTIPVPVDDQPAIDQAAAEVEAIAAKIPA